MQPNKNLALKQAKGVFKGYNSVLSAEFRAACEEGCKELDTLAKTVASVSDMKTYRQVHQQLLKSYDRICTDFESLIMQKKEDKAAQSVAGADLMDDSVLQFHNDDLELVTHDELEYQIRLESAYTHVRRAFEALLFEAGMDATGRSFVGDNPISGSLEHIRPGRQALLIQHLFDANLPEAYIARIAFRFLGCRFFTSVGSNYVNWSGDVKQMAKNLDLKPSLSLTPMGEGEGGSVEVIDAPAEAVTEMVPVQEGMVTVSEQLLEKVNELLDNISRVDIPAALEASGKELPSLSDAGPVPDGATVETVDTQALNRILEQFQAPAEQPDESAAQLEAPDSPEDVRQQLKSALTKMSDENIMTVIDRVSENIINLVCHLFQSITDNQALHPEAGFQISRVQLPIMRLALTDSTMFRNESHPARTYINNLGRLGLNVTESGDENLTIIKNSVEKLLDQFSGNNEVFHQLNNFLEPYTLPLICEEAEQDDDHGGQLITPAQVLEFLDNQQNRIQREFVLHRFARIAWESLLSRIFHQSGINSKQWRVATAAYAAVVWSTQIDLHQESDKRQVLRRIPKIVVDVKDLFKQYQLSDGVCETVLNMMYDIHKQILQGVPLMEVVDADGDALGQNTGPVVIDVKASESTLVDDSGDVEVVDGASDGYENAGDAPRVDQLSLSGGQRVNTAEGAEEQAPVVAVQAETAFASARRHAAVDVEEVEAQPILDVAQVDQMIHRYRVGEVFELAGDDGQCRRYQLSHVSNVMGVYYFREFGSTALLEIAKPELVILTLQHTLRKLCGSSVFDDSLGSILSRLEDSSEMDSQGPAVA